MSLVPYGLAVYLLLNYQLHDDAFAFVDFQKEFWHHEQVMPWTTLNDAIRWVTETPPGMLRTEVYELLLVFTALSAALLILGTLVVRPSYLVFGWFSLIFFLMVSFQISLPRYVLTIFPMYFVMARLGRNPEANQAMITVSALIMGGLFVVYATSWGF